MQMSSCYLVNVKTVIVDVLLKSVLSVKIAAFPLELINGKTQLGSASIPVHDPIAIHLTFVMSVI